jgi:hypothetical protein
LPPRSNTKCDIRETNPLLSLHESNKTAVKLFSAKNDYNSYNINSGRTTI